MISENRNRWKSALRRLSGVRSRPLDASAATSYPDSPGEPATVSLAADFPFEKRTRLLSEREAELYQRVVRAVGGAAIVCPKIRVTSVLRVREGGRDIDHAARIDRKTIDLLLCQQGTMEPRLAIQIDDWNEERGRYQTRDPYVDRALATAGVTVFHVRDDQFPSLQRMRDRILPLFADSSAASNVVHAEHRSYIHRRHSPR